MSNDWCELKLFSRLKTMTTPIEVYFVCVWEQIDCVRITRHIPGHMLFFMNCRYRHMVSIFARVQIVMCFMSCLMNDPNMRCFYYCYYFSIAKLHCSSGRPRRAENKKKNGEEKTAERSTSSVRLSLGESSGLNIFIDWQSTRKFSEEIEVKKCKTRILGRFSLVSSCVMIWWAQTNDISFIFDCCGVPLPMLMCVQRAYRRLSAPNAYTLRIGHAAVLLFCWTSFATAISFHCCRRRCCYSLRSH